MPISEICSCGARIDLIPGMDLNRATRFINSWRSDHKHEIGKDNTPKQFNMNNALGFALPQSEDYDE